MSGRGIQQYLSVEFPSPTSLDLTLAGEHDMEFYTQIEPDKIPQQTATTTFHHLTALESHKDEPIHAINLTTVNTDNQNQTEETLFDEFISLVDGTQKTDRRLTCTSNSLADLSKSCINTSQQQQLPSYHTTAQQHHYQQRKRAESDEPIGEQENIFPARTRRILSTSGPPSFNTTCKPGFTPQKQNYQNNTNISQGGSDGSLLRQQLQGTLCSSQYKRGQETSYNCNKCRKPLTAKCILGTCMKSDEVLCPRCGQELTAKCLMDMCSCSSSSRQHRPSI
jgi:DNA-directed RNA polymerase subunit RPC12/RpoP